MYRQTALKLPDPTPAPVESKFDANKPWKEDSKIRLWIGSNTVLWPLLVRDGDPNNEAAGPKISVRPTHGISELCIHGRLTVDIATWRLYPPYI